MIPIIAAIVAATAAGIAAERRWPERAGHDSRRALIWILYVVLPPVTFFNLVHVSFDADLGGGIALAWVATIAAAGLAWFLGARVLDLTRPQVGAVIACTFVANTAYARQPPPPRSFAFFSFGGGVRLTLKPTDRFGVYLQGSLGGGAATEDVLEIYGYQHADELGMYQSAQLGLEWYQVNPHLALALHGGVRNYPRTLKRDRDSQPPLGWLSAAALRYTF